MKFFLLRSFLFIFSFSVFGVEAPLSKGLFTKKEVISRPKVLGGIVKGFIENYHFLHPKIDKAYSQNTFDEYLKTIDSQKQIFLLADIEKFKIHRDVFGEQFASGNLKGMEEITNRHKEQMTKISTWVFEILKKHQFTFSSERILELDGKKRDYAKTEEELKNRWTDIVEYAVLNKYVMLLEELEKEKKKSKKISEKEKKELLVKAIDSQKTKYEKFFERQLTQDEDTKLDDLINSFTVIADQHTNYFPPKKSTDFKVEMSGELEGIGAVLKEEGDYIKVEEIVPGGPAWRQKELEVGDLILMVAQGKQEFVDIVGMRVGDAVQLIRGKKETEVRLMVKKASGTKQTLTIKRDKVQIAATYAKSSILEEKGSNTPVGYIFVPKFYRDFGQEERNCTEDVKKEIERLKPLKIKGLILDLRQNGGGPLKDAVEIAGLFVKSGPIVQTKDYEGKIEVLSDPNSSVAYDGPLVVLVDSFSASASEIVAAALQDYKRAIVVGSTTHGKGTVQAVLGLSDIPILGLLQQDLGAMKVTIQKFYRVNGHSTQSVGVTPDIYLPDPYEGLKTKEKDLDYALPWDQVKPLKYQQDIFLVNSKKLESAKEKSLKRQKEDEKLARIKSYGEFLAKKSEDTQAFLNLEKVRQESKETEEKTKMFKEESKNEKFLISSHQGSLREHIDIRKGEEKLIEEDLKRKDEDWIKKLQTDAVLQEAYRILVDTL